jgi:hypothetical protein
MKKKKQYIYFLIPIVGLVIFSVFYKGAVNRYEQREEDVRKQIRAEKEAKLQKEMKDREKAIKDAQVAQERRKAERKAKIEKDEKEKEAREAAIQARNKAGRDADKLEAQVKRLQKEISDEKDAIAKIEEDRKKSGEEEAFLRDYVKKAEANQKNLTAVLDKIADADKKIDEMRKAAAQKKKESK